VDELALRQYQERWRAVAEVEEIEQLRATPAMRWRQVNSLIRMAAALELTLTDSDDGDEEVWRRWNLLRAAYLDRQREH
jgi:hypothetical protein